MPAKELHKILLAEDEADIRTIARFALEVRGKFNVHFCSSGQEALDNVEAFEPDLILLDVMMPGMDGLATLEALKKSDKTKNIPVIFMTAKVQSSEVVKYKELGAIEVISKPFNATSLADQLREIWKTVQSKNEMVK